MTKTRRQERVASLFEMAISEIIRRDLHFDKAAFISVSGVEMSGDLKLARIYFRIFGQISPEKVLAYLEKRKGFIRKILASKVNLKYNPELIFLLDPRAEHEQKIDSLIEKIKKK
ncbi:MAG: 30S ribosome-binding factor RbfA [Candidatus Aminicenantes bacterium]|nr:30S ribosome-binding factor RbfA [Candidatus Aminicenantes bacterium]